MPINRARKEELVARYVDLLGQSDGFALVEIKGMPVPQVEAMRGAIREVGGQYVVTKLTLLKIALEQAGWTVPEELLTGPISVAFGKENFPGVAKAVFKFIKDENAGEVAQITGGILTGDILDASAVEAVSNLPSLDELRGQIAGIIVSPATGLVNVLHSATGQVVNVLQAYLDDRGAGDEGEAA